MRPDADKPYACPTCGKRFAEANYVKKHQRVHTGVKPFSCTQCHMRFAQAGDLRWHLRVHTGEKPYSCPQCEKRFSRQYQLNVHLKIHTGETPFASTILLIHPQLFLFKPLNSVNVLKSPLASW
ncbi:protein krueppel-like [Salmo salar]|uniref:Protein krueppel-like n=1 Tax=Salmo salar TaxID=8030 RepID=A0ABM3F793_SALSA|nr:protein krueppel-like [Salmo salar]